MNIIELEQRNVWNPERSVFSVCVSTSEYSLFSSLAHILADRLFCVFNFCSYLYILYLRPLWSIAGRDFHSSYRLSVYTAASFFAVQLFSFKVSLRTICCVIGVILKKVYPTSVSWNVFLQKFYGFSVLYWDLWSNGNLFLCRIRDKYLMSSAFGYVQFS